MTVRSLLAMTMFLSALCLTMGTPAAQTSLPPDLFSGLEYRHVGPVGNRISAVVGVSGDRNVYYAGAASGGIFKSEDGGASWSAIFDEQPAQSIGAIAIAPSDSNVVWVGTGEAHIRSNVSIGNGVYLSTDGGRTWEHRGLDKTGRIARLVVHPRNPGIAWVAALGHLYGPQQERGIFKTTDSGESWERVLFVDANTGASDLIIDPNNPRILFAGMWQMVIWTWGRQSGGPGSGLYRTKDGGQNWRALAGNGLPEAPWGKVALSVSADNSRRIYALIETNSHEDFLELEEHQGVLWTSDNGGDNWRLTNSDHTLAQRPHYYSRVYAAPDDFNEVHFLSTRHSKSLNGGRTFERFPSGGDHHDIWIDPLLPDRIIVGHDQGVELSTTRGRSWLRPQLPHAQMYHVDTDNQVPYFLYGNRQDGPSFTGPSNTLTRGSIPIGAWHSVGGCESGFAVPDPVDSNIVWSGCYEGILDRYDRLTGHRRNVSVWPDNAEGWPGEDLKYRFQWTFPILISPHDHNRVYVGSQFVHVTKDGGQSWRVISPDLTSDDKSRQKKFGGLTPDDEGPTIWPVVFALAESPLERGVIWAGTNDGRLQITRDGGENWRNVTGNIAGLPPLGTVSNIEASRFEEGKAYVAVDLHQVNDPNPYVFKTEDYGENWHLITSGIPKTVFSYAHGVREDSVRPGLLYLGTENSLFVSLNDGQSWHSLQTNLPQAPVHWISIQDHFRDLVVATYGRGFWILDDMTPIQNLDEQVLRSDVHLFAPRPAYRFRFKEAASSQPEDPVAGRNPEYGASLNYYLAASRDDLEMTIETPDGELVRTLKDPPAKAGINRVYWDLRYDTLPRPRLRTRPRHHSHVSLEDQGYRLLREGRSVAPLAPPGTYEIQLRTGGELYSQSLEVVKDPNSAGSLEDIEWQTGVVLDLREMMQTATRVIEEIEATRKQLDDLLSRLGEENKTVEIQEEILSVGRKLRDLERQFFDLRLTGARQDILWWPRKLYSKMTILLGVIQQSDFRPTDQQLEVYELYKTQLEGTQKEWDRLRSEEIADLNRRLNRQGLAVLGK